MSCTINFNIFVANSSFDCNGNSCFSPLGFKYVAIFVSPSKPAPLVFTLLIIIASSFFVLIFLRHMLVYLSFLQQTRQGIDLFSVLPMIVKCLWFVPFPDLILLVAFSFYPSELFLFVSHLQHKP